MVTDPPFLGGGIIESKRGTSRVDGRRRMDQQLRSDDQPLDESRARHVMGLPGVRPPIKQRRNLPKTAGPTPQRRLKL
jgi:hypothetical protein